MKKILKLSLVIVCMMLLLSNYCYATNNITENEDTGEGIPAEWLRTLDPNVSEEDMILDGALESLTGSNENDGIMLINGDFELPGNVIDSDIYMCKENISIENEVSGNVYVIGKNINISSDYLTGNVFAIGQNVVIKGAVSGSIYVMGETVSIETDSVDTVYAIGKNVNLLPNSNIIFDFKVSADTLNISGNVNRELDAYVENIKIDEKSEYIAKGKVSYAGELTDTKGILETVEISKHEKAEVKTEKVKQMIIADKIRSKVTTIISTIIIIAVIYLIIKNRETEKIDNYPQEIVSKVLKGFMWLIVAPIIIVMLICTLIGLPVALLMLVLYIIGLFISVPIASLRIAEIIYGNNPTQSKLMMLLYAIGVYVAIELISLVPSIGGIIKFLVVLYGFESLIKYIFPSKSKKINKEEVVVITDENN